MLDSGRLCGIIWTEESCGMERSVSYFRPPNLDTLTPRLSSKALRSVRVSYFEEV